MKNILLLESDNCSASPPSVCVANVSLAASCEIPNGDSAKVVDALQKQTKCNYIPVFINHSNDKKIEIMRRTHHEIVSLSISLATNCFQKLCVSLTIFVANSAFFASPSNAN